MFPSYQVLRRVSSPGKKQPQLQHSDIPLRKPKDKAKPKRKTHRISSYEREHLFSFFHPLTVLHQYSPDAPLILQQYLAFEQPPANHIEFQNFQAFTRFSAIAELSPVLRKEGRTSQLGLSPQEHSGTDERALIKRQRRSDSSQLHCERCRSPQSCFAPDCSYVGRLISYDWKLTTGSHFYKENMMMDGSMLFQCHC